MANEAVRQQVESFGKDPTGRVGVLLANLGSPDAPTAHALRRYLREFLWDPRVVDLPRPFWWLILNGVILNTRPAKSAKLYAEVWTDDGAPLLAISRRQLVALREALERKGAGGVELALGMRYGNPGIRAGLEELRDHGCTRVLVAPLYPQYSCTTNATVFDAVAEVFRSWRHIPELRMLHDYHAHAGYIEALALSVREAWTERGKPDRLLISFHGLPQRYADTGDPYPDQCLATAKALSRALELAEDEWQMVFQSRFGREEWLKPYLDQTLKECARRGVGRVDLICPGFSADCLETLEEVAMSSKTVFLTAGGESYHYIPALNDRPDFIEFLADLVIGQLCDWETKTEPAEGRGEGTPPREIDPEKAEL